MSGYPWGRPGVLTPRAAQHRKVFLSQDKLYLPAGRLIDGAQSRDPGNSGNVGALRPGLLMGQITSSGYYAPSVVGVLQSAYTSGGTSLTVTAAQATEIERLCGQAGTAELVAIGPPTANGTVAVTDITHSAIDTTTGVLTVSSLGANKVAGTLIARKDGRQLPRWIMPDLDFPVYVLDRDGASLATVECPLVPVFGVIDSSQILPVWPSDTSIRTWIADQINTTEGVQYIFDHKL